MYSYVYQSKNFIRLFVLKIKILLNSLKNINNDFKSFKEPQIDVMNIILIPNFYKI